MSGALHKCIRVVLLLRVQLGVRLQAELGGAWGRRPKETGLEGIRQRSRGADVVAAVQGARVHPWTPAMWWSPSPSAWSSVLACLSVWHVGHFRRQLGGAPVCCLVPGLCRLDHLLPKGPGAALRRPRLIQLAERLACARPRQVTVAARMVAPVAASCVMHAPR